MCEAVGPPCSVVERSCLTRETKGWDKDKTISNLGTLFFFSLLQCRWVRGLENRKHFLGGELANVAPAPERVEREN